MIEEHDYWKEACYLLGEALRDRLPATAEGFMEAHFHGPKELNPKEGLVSDALADLLEEADK